MKKTLLLIIASIFMIAEANAQSAYAKQLAKERKKEYKTAMKQLKSEKWKPLQVGRSVEVLLLEYYSKLESLGEKGYGITGEAKVGIKSSGEALTYNNASLKYAQQCGTKIRGRIVRDMANQEANIQNDFSNFYSAYESLVEKEIRGELKASFTVYRDLPNGGYDFQTYFIIDEDAATNARVRAYENAARESEAAQRYADKVAKFVRDGFKEE